MFVVVSNLANKIKQFWNCLYVFELIYFICAQCVQCVHRTDLSVQDSLLRIACIISIGKVGYLLLLVPRDKSLLFAYKIVPKILNYYFHLLWLCVSALCTPIQTYSRTKLAYCAVNGSFNISHLCAAVWLEWRDCSLVEFCWCHILQNVMNPAPGPSTKQLYSALPDATQLHGRYLPRAAIECALTCSFTCCMWRNNGQAPKCTSK
jgi:hypothetical protein